MVHDLAGDAFVERVTLLKGQTRSFVLSPDQWRTYSLTHPMVWQSVKFDDNNQISVPEERGVYAFVVRHDNGYFPPHGYIMYVGITGSTKTQRTLRTRYGEYIRERQRNKRPAVHYMLNAYKDDLFFLYVPIADTDVRLDELERALNDAIIPPVSKKDFSAEVRALIGAI